MKTFRLVRKLNPPSMHAALLPVSCDLIKIRGIAVLNEAMPCFWSTQTVSDLAITDPARTYGNDCLAYATLGKC